MSTQPTWNETGAKWSVEDSVKFLKNIEMENYVFPMKKSGMLDKFGMATLMGAADQGLGECAE